MKIVENFGRPLRILTWHIHGSYLYYLTQTPCEFYLPVTPEKGEGYGGRAGSFPWGDNVYDVPAEKVKDYEFDCILFQSKKNYIEDQYKILTPEQRALPKIFLEHDPPREVPTDTKHVVDDSEVLLTHVTHFNNLMWNNNQTRTTVIPHGVMVDSNVQYSGELDKGIVVINGLAKRGRRLGLDVFERVREEVPLDIIGMGSKDVGGIGEVPITELPSFISKYRFFFNPIRYTSLGLAVCEAMMAGMPIVGLATTEMSVAIENNVSGFIHTDVNYLIDKMKLLMEDRQLANKLSQGAMRSANEKFGMERFTSDWLNIFEYMAQKKIEQRSVEKIRVGGEL